MATEVLMPRQGQSVESCIINSWMVKEGDVVSEGQPLCEVETDKATFEVEAPADGTMLGIFYPEDSDVEVLKIIAAIGEPGEDISAMKPAEEELKDTVPQQEERESTEDAGKTDDDDRKAAISEPVIQADGASGHVGVSPRARNLAADKGVDLSVLAGSGPQGRVIERDVLAAVNGKAPLTPAAKAQMAQGGMQAPAAGSGIGGRVRMADLQRDGGKVTLPAFPGPVEEIPVKGVRKVVAARMMDSLQNTAQLTLNTSADASDILNYRKKCKAAPEEYAVAGISINDMVLFATAKVVQEFPALNAHWQGTAIKQFQHVHLGFAVNTERGLMVPVIKFADCMTLKQISAEAKRLVAACQTGSIDPSDMSGATFTVTNLGAAGIESFTPVLNPPEVGILGICAIQPKPVMSGEEVDFIPHMGLSLTFDHRATDGAPAAMFLTRMRERLASFTFEMTIFS